MDIMVPSKYMIFFECFLSPQEHVTWNEGAGGWSIPPKIRDLNNNNTTNKNPLLHTKF